MRQICNRDRITLSKIITCNYEETFIGYYYICAVVMGKFKTRKAIARRVDMFNDSYNCLCLSAVIFE